MFSVVENLLGALRNKNFGKDLFNNIDLKLNRVKNQIILILFALEPFSQRVGIWRIVKMCKRLYPLFWRGFLFLFSSAFLIFPQLR